MPLVETSDVSQINNTLDNNASKNLFVLTFWAPWAPQCEQMKDIIKVLTVDPSYESVTFLNIEAEKCPEICQKYEINAVPTSVLVKSGTVVGRVRGVHPVELRQQVLNCLSSAVSGNSTNVPAAPSNSVNLSGDDHLKQLINQAPLMIFMKGNPLEPRCKFSRALMQILSEQGVPLQDPTYIQTFDILNDETVREGLKKFSNWPTYPQVYVKGELIGGLDIIKEMAGNGDLKRILPTTTSTQATSLDTRLHELINRAPVMLFMKGSPQEPRCGFSKQTVALLQEVGCKFEYFDILTDNEVREGLKKFSNWPTYPQIYVNGELVGGLDILKELKEGGELVSTLNLK